MSKERIAKRTALEMQDGFLVNLGIGLPTLISNYIEDDKEIYLQSENGMVDIGPKQDPVYDPDICNAGGVPVSILEGGAYFDSSLSFAIIRGGHVDVTVLGAFEVDQQGDIASYIIPGKAIAGMGGAMDLLVGSKKIIVTMLHTNKGVPKILKKCTLPVTAKNRVDMIITEMGVMEYQERGLVLLERFSDYSVEDIIAATEAELIIDENIRVRDE